jgi:enediyne polyketide synthase
VAALRTGDSVKVVIRSSDTSFAADHFRATLRYAGAAALDAGPGRALAGDGRVPLNPATDLYGQVFFQGKRFQRVLDYRRLAATSCVAEISAVPVDGWFSGYLPATLLLGDPGTRDAFMHAIQCCVPNATLLPAGVERIYPAGPPAPGDQVTLHAVERSRVGDSYTYDLDVRDAAGAVVERWEGLRLQAVRKTDGSGPWVPALLGPYLERQAAEFLPGAPRCAVEPDPSELSRYAQSRRGQTTVALRRMLERPVTVLHRGDGRPGLIGEDTVISASHGAGVTLVVGHAGPVSCDVETVRQRTAADWEGLLGPGPLALAQLTQRERGEDLSVAATRVWSAVESLRKTGRVLPGSLTLDPAGRDGWVIFTAGRSKIATFATRVRSEPAPVIFAIQTEGDGHESVLRVPARRWFRRDQPGGKRLLRELRALARPVP